MTATKGLITAAATTALDTRKAYGHLFVNDAADSPRIGVLTEDPSIVTTDASTAPMRVAVAKAGFVTQRSAGDGVAEWTNDGSLFVTVTKPGSNSWYVVIWAKHNDTASGDGTSLPEINVTTGTAAASPSVPSIPAGALELARILIPSTATSTQSAGVVLTNKYPMTALRGGVVQLRDSTEQTAWTPEDGGLAYRQDDDALYLRDGGAWAQIGGTGGWTNLGLAANWVTVANYGVPQYRVINGKKELRGTCRYNATIPVTIVAMLSGAPAPTPTDSNAIWMIATSNAQTVLFVNPRTDGIVRVQANVVGGGGTDYAHLDGLSYY